MAKSRWGAPRFVPAWPHQMLPVSGTGPSMGSPGNLDAVGEKCVMIGAVQWEDGGTHDIHSIKWRSSGAGSLTGTLQVSIRDVDLANGPPGRDDGGVDQSVNHTNPAADTNFTSTMSADRTSVAHGTLLAFVWEVTARTSGITSPLVCNAQGSSVFGHPLVCTFLASTWAATNNLPLMTLVAADGTLGILAGGLPYVEAANAATAFHTGSAIDEYALAFTPEETCWAGAFHVFLQPAGNSTTFDIVLYEGTTALVTISIDPQTVEVNGSPLELIRCFADQKLTAGTTYYLAIKPTAGNPNTVTIWIMNPPSGEAHLFGGVGCGAVGRADAGAWSAIDTSALLIKVSLGIVACDDGGAGYQPNLSGDLS
jgi:hypothetical protein